nr:DUF4402 domain-containing protein [Novosphingobium piscinae]
MALLAAPAAAAPGASASGSAAAQVVAPLAVAREADLDFGTVAIAASGPGTVAVAPLGGGTRYTGGASGVCALACPAPHPARFAVEGEPLRSYRVVVPDSLTITATSGGSGGGAVPVRIDGLTIAAASTRSGSGGELSPVGRDHFEVGGTLHLPAGAAEGHYTAQVPVIVTYL